MRGLQVWCSRRYRGKQQRFFRVCPEFGSPFAYVLTSTPAPVSQTTPATLPWCLSPPRVTIASAPADLSAAATTSMVRLLRFVQPRRACDILVTRKKRNRLAFRGLCGANSSDLLHFTAAEAVGVDCAVVIPRGALAVGSSSVPQRRRCSLSTAR